MNFHRNLARSNIRIRTSQYYYKLEMIQGLFLTSQFVVCLGRGFSTSPYNSVISVLVFQLQFQLQFVFCLYSTLISLLICSYVYGNICQDLNSFPLQNWSRSPGHPRYTRMKTIQQDLKSNNMSLNEAIFVGGSESSTLETDVYI